MRITNFLYLVIYSILLIGCGNIPMPDKQSKQKKMRHLSKKFPLLVGTLNYKTIAHNSFKAHDFSKYQVVIYDVVYNNEHNKKEMLNGIKEVVQSFKDYKYKHPIKKEQYIVTYQELYKECVNKLEPLNLNSNSNSRDYIIAESMRDGELYGCEIYAKAHAGDKKIRYNGTKFEVSNPKTQVGELYRAQIIASYKNGKEVGGVVFSLVEDGNYLVLLRAVMNEYGYPPFKLIRVDQVFISIFNNNKQITATRPKIKKYDVAHLWKYFKEC